MQRDEDSVASVMFSPDDEILLPVGDMQTFYEVISFWDLRSGISVRYNVSPRCK